MLILNKVAVTGGLACGKSTVCQFFKELGAYTLSADEIVHRLLSPFTPPGQQVLTLLGDDVIVNGQFARDNIAKKVFNNPALLQSLENILHPAVLTEIEKQYQQFKQENRDLLFVAEVPLLFEIAAENNFDYVIAVLSNHKDCVKRFKTSTGYNEEEYNSRMARQLPPIEKAKRADYVIENYGAAETMRFRVEQIFNQLTSLSIKNKH